MLRALVLICALIAGQAGAQARVDAGQSQLRDSLWALDLTLALDAVVPYRVFTLDDPRRLVLDFQGLDWGDLDAASFDQSDRAAAVRFGPFRPGWARMVVDLAEPLTLASAQMTDTGAGAVLRIALQRSTDAAFARAAGAPPDPEFAALAAIDPAGLPPRVDDGRFVVVLDPGHGGIDPGAERAGLREADLMLDLARALAADLQQRDNLAVVLTREGDVFVPLFQRMSIARAAGADLFISLHADALAQDDAWGASVYTLSTDGDDDTTALLVARHERGDLLAGVDLADADDRVAATLMDMLRRQNEPRGADFADQLVAELGLMGVRLNTRPRRMGRFSVLLAPDFPSVLIEVGFLSNDRDRANLADPAGRARLVAALARAISSFAAQNPPR